ncbi:phosphatase PAP2 family protein [Roseisolibacter sp. H3M3-2]|uniref:phosphatase PAP2 family protein n=1 Tax=Roseisolibacter sp. H3M3-2 TaxID=3031323 RepID=UPI0023DBC3C9|nr:phosphatase PAP2 family protein [Roseisolibacter sp. H3M3-2]MDF1503436.1 phosphatase PAP2 family protein [Roseisolibacter sp. H3M3-2]
MSDPVPPTERRAPRRTPPHGLIAGAVRLSRARFHDLRAALGLVVLGGAALAACFGVAFAWVAHRVRAGSTQAFDEAALRWVAAHQIGWLEAAMLELTFLGTATVVLTIAGVAALFLALTRQRTAAAVLLWSTLGAILLNNVLKSAFDRPRPTLFEWGTQVRTTSFPSGHAMSAAAIYATVAFLAARLAHRPRVRAAIYATSAVLIVLVAASRVYLGVHYPTDVAAGLLVGFAWAAFCAAALEAGQQLSARRRGDPRSGPAPHPAAQDPAASMRSKVRSK